MARYVVLGSGRQGTSAAYDLIRNGGEVYVVDQSMEALNRISKHLGIPKHRTYRANFTRKPEMMPILERVDGVLFAADYKLNLDLTAWAIEAGCHAVDFGGNHDIVKQQHLFHDQAVAADVTIIPDTGFTPGLVGILIAEGMKQMELAQQVQIFAGGLPLEPEPPLNYGILFSVRGLLNEYVEPSVVIENGSIRTRPSLTELEEFEFRGRVFEAFLTSGGVSTIPETLGHRIRNLSCKTLRYPGHADFIRSALTLGFADDKEFFIGTTKLSPRSFFESMLERQLPHDPKDEIIMIVRIEGEQKRITWTLHDTYDKKNRLTAMQRITAWPGTALLKMIVEGEIEKRGVLYQETDIPTERVIEEVEKRGITIEQEVEEFTQV